MKTTRCLGEWFFLVLGCLDDLGQPETQYPMERRQLADILATSHALLNTLFDDEPLPFHFTFSGCLLCEIQTQPENGFVFCGWLWGSFNHASRADGALTFLCFAKE